MLRRRDFAQWLDKETIRDSLKNAFVKVIYHKQYVVAQIKDFMKGGKVYKLDQLETKWMAELSRGG